MVMCHSFFGSRFIISGVRKKVGDVLSNSGINIVELTHHQYQSVYPGLVIRTQELSISF
jgi:hypothetical protein